MKNEFVRFLTQDGLELQGLFWSSNSKNAVVYVHCLAGNFYDSHFLDYLASELNKNGFDLFTFNNRGHDYISDFTKYENECPINVQIGAAHEVFEDCVFDIRAAIDLVEKRHYSKIYVAGHSTGALKITFYSSSTHDQRLNGLILLSPSDDIGIQRKNLGEKYDSILKIAKNLTQNGKSRELMPSGLFNYPIIDARTYLATFGSDSKIGLFKFHLEGFDFPELRNANCPILVIFGTEREAVAGDVRKAAGLLRKLSSRGVQITVDLVEDAPHNYLNHEKELAGILTGWVKRQIY